MSAKMKISHKGAAQVPSYCCSQIIAGQRKCVEPSESLSYEATLKRAGLLFSLERRRAGGNVAEAYKIMKGIDQASLVLLITFLCNNGKREDSK